MKRWEEEVSLLKKDMVNFISWYMDVEMPRLKKVAEGSACTEGPRKSFPAPYPIAWQRCVIWQIF